jgi:ribosome-associated toxin RatA of RatAB toxin-antitoxin module
MAKAETHEVMHADRDKLYQTITRYEDYPKFIDGCTTAEVERKGAGHARVKYGISVMGKDISYTLDHREDPENGVVEWSLIESDFFKVNSGRWKIKSVGDKKTDIVYEVDIEFKIYVPGMILNKIVKGNFPTLIKSFEKQAQKS